MRMKDLSDQLSKRGYQKQIIYQAIGRVRQMDRLSLLSYRPKPTADKAILPFVITYHPDLPKVRNIVDKHLPIIESSDHLNSVFPQKPIMAFRRPKSLRELLERARLKPDPTDEEPHGECKPCGRPRCRTCDMITPSQIASVCCLDHNSGWTDKTRKQRESYWIRRLNTLNPSGINKGD